MGTRVEIAEYMSARPAAGRHALSVALKPEQADTWVMVRFEGDTIAHNAKWRPHFVGVLPTWPNLIGRTAMQAYIEALPHAATALRQEVRAAGHRACLAGLVTGLSLALWTSNPAQPAFWVSTACITLAAYQGARIHYARHRRKECERLEHLLGLSCLAVRSYLGEFGYPVPQTAQDPRLDAAGQTCLGRLRRSSDPIEREALSQYDRWAQQQRPTARATQIRATQAGHPVGVAMR